MDMLACGPTLADDPPITITVPLSCILELDSEHNQRYIVQQAVEALNTPPGSPLLIYEPYFGQQSTISATNYPQEYSYFGPYLPIATPTAYYSQGLDNMSPITRTQPMLDALQCRGEEDKPTSAVPIDTEMCFSLPRVSAKRRSFKNQLQRNQTARLRKIGSCIRCRVQKIRCVEDEEGGENAPCLPCKTNPAPWVFRMGCSRWRIQDLKLFRPDQFTSQMHSNQWTHLPDIHTERWNSTELQTMSVGVGSTGKYVDLTVRRFEALEGNPINTLASEKDTPMSMGILTYAIESLDTAAIAFGTYIKEVLADCCETRLGPKEHILWQTYRMAIAISQDDHTPFEEVKLLESALILWASCDLVSQSFSIVEHTTLGLCGDPTVDHHAPRGRRPLPPVIGAQIECILVNQFQGRFGTATLEQLDKLLSDRKPGTWLTRYLVIFILLHIIAVAIRQDAQYAARHGVQIQFTREDMVKDYDEGANTLLAYFHYCNKSVYPFSVRCHDNELGKIAQLNAQGFQIINETRKYAARRSKLSSQWRDLWESGIYEDECFYVSQLYNEEWEPKLMALDQITRSSGRRAIN